MWASISHFLADTTDTQNPRALPAPIWKTVFSLAACGCCPFILNTELFFPPTKPLLCVKEISLVLVFLFSFYGLWASNHIYKATFQFGSLFWKVSSYLWCHLHVLYLINKVKGRVFPPPAHSLRAWLDSTGYHAVFLGQKPGKLG